MTTGSEVIFKDGTSKDSLVYCCAPPETGLSRISINKFEDFLAAELSPLSFGSSSDEFVFVFELAELEEWGRLVKATRDYVSYRPKSRRLLSVGQVEWKVVKDLPLEMQLPFLIDALTAAGKGRGKLGSLGRLPRALSRPTPAPRCHAG